VQPTTPAGLARNAFFIFLLQRARAAQATLDIENAYCLEHAVLRRELQAACARGVRVRLFTNSAESNDLPFMNHRLLARMAQLVEAGVQVYLRPGKGRTVHGKYFVADGEWLALGTSNLDYYSPRFCLELGLHLRDRTLGAALSAWFEEGIAQAQRIEDAASLAAQAGADTVGRLFDRWLRDIQ
jgi:phosphatidylserine/phosphatidylglycerophosphate/cardiolipin synthase-like enzyme